MPSQKRPSVDDSSQRRWSKSSKQDDAEKEALEAKMLQEKESCIRSLLNNHPQTFPNTPFGIRAATAYAAKHKNYGAAVASLNGGTPAEVAAKTAQVVAEKVENDIFSS